MATFKVIYDLFIRNKSKGVIPKLDNQVKGLEKSTGRLNNSFKAFGAVLATAGVGAFLTSAIKLTAQTDAMNTAILLSASSAKIGQTNLAFLNKTVQDLQLDSASAKEGFKTLAGSFQKTKLEGKEMRRLFLSVSKASRVMGLSADQQKGVFTALGQIMSKGTVSSEELKQQMGDRLPGAFQIAARSLGVTTKELNKLLETGKVLSADFLPKFATELEKTFGPKAAKITESLQGSLNVLNNAFRKMKLSVGRFAAPAINNFSKIIERATKDNRLFSRTFGDQARLIITNSITLDNNIRKLKETNVNTESRIRLVKEVNKELGLLNLRQITQTSTIRELNKVQKAANVLLLSQAVAAKRREAVAELIEDQASNAIDSAERLAKADEFRIKILTEIKDAQAGALVSGKALTDNQRKAIKIGGELARKTISGADALEKLRNISAKFLGEDITKTIKGQAFLIKDSEELAKFVLDKNKGITSELNKQQKITDQVLKQFQAQTGGKVDPADPFPTLPGGAAAGTGQSVSQQVNNIAGRAPKNIIINIDKLVEQLNVTAATITESGDEIRTQMTRVFLEVVNDANIIDP